LTTYIYINGHKAFTLFNSGCTTEAASPNFARVAGIKVFPIKLVITLQLGTAGSRSKVNHGAEVTIKYGPILNDEYVDIINLDRFNAVIGTKFMRKHGILLDFKNDRIKVNTKNLAEIFMTAAEQHADELKDGDKPLFEEDIPRLRKHWMEISKDIMSGVPEKMPSLREINHRIPLVDEKKMYNYHLPRCPDAMKDQLIEKINKYVRAGWWKAVQTDQAAPMLCIPK
ncbi:hypothetical protein C8R44DRAFT_530178, partial [Mycena epipterygia]